MLELKERLDQKTPQNDEYVTVRKLNVLKSTVNASMMDRLVLLNVNAKDAVTQKYNKTKKIR